jgi:imidazolonepropionase-like amidohydrolase
VRGNRIEAVGDAADVTMPDGAERIDLSGRTIKRR